MTGEERWRPQARITRVDGRAIGGARVLVGPYATWVPASPPPGTQADANGIWTSPERAWVDDPPPLAAYGGRGQRGFSLQGASLTVKLQASSTCPAGPVGVGTPLTVTGNVWPAPSIFAAEAGPLTLQRRTAAGWSTVATGGPRLNGRYTLTWPPPGAGSYVLRVGYAGGGSPLECREQSIGTNLAATTVLVR